MPRATQAYLDLNIRHSIGLARYGTATVRKILSLLNLVDDDIVEQIQRHSWEDVTRQAAKAARLTKMLEAIRVTSKEAYEALQKTLRSELIDLAGYEGEFQASALVEALRVSGAEVEVGFAVQPTAEQLKAVVDSRPFQGFVLKDWSRQLQANALRRVEQAIQIGYVEGESVASIARRIRGTRANQYRDGVLEISRRGAEGLVQTAVNHVASAAKEEFWQSNPDVIKGVRWTSVLDGRTTPICRARDGKVYPVGSGPRPPAHWRCRSTTVGVLEGDEAPEETYQTWLKRQPADVQDEILGKAKAELFRKGGLTLDKFVDDKGRSYTLAELKRREAEAFRRAGLSGVDLDEPPPLKPQPFGDTIPEELWRHELHFGGARQVVKDVIARTKALGSAADENVHSFYLPSDASIHMGPELTQDAYGVVWRHEYGHHIDHAHSDTPNVGISAGKAQTIIDDAYALIENQKPTDIKKLNKEISKSADRIYDVPDENRPTVLRSEMEKMLKETGISPEDVTSLSGTPGQSGMGALYYLRMAQRIKQGDYHQFLKDTYAQGNDDQRRVTTMLADLIGAATNNRVGFGHANAYYMSPRFQRNAEEVMANYTALVGGSRPMDRAAENIARALLLNVMKEFDDLFASIARG
jgi:SPP1 gp7 family putative phage head morphogenesis protein